MLIHSIQATPYTYRKSLRACRQRSRAERMRAIMIRAMSLKILLLTVVHIIAALPFFYYQLRETNT